MKTRIAVHRSRGFTLIEVLVALLAMALMAGLGWRGLDGLLRAREASQSRMDHVAVLQTALAQWQSDLDTALSLPGTQGLPGLSWDGRVLRIVRRSSVADPSGADAGLWVVSWTVRQLNPDEAEQIGLSRQNPPQAWVRTQAPASADRQVLQQYWAAAAQGAGSPTQTTSPNNHLSAGLSTADLISAGAGTLSANLFNGAAAPPSTAVLFPAQQWQLFYFRGDAWSNPLSSSGTVSAGQDAAIPDGVRLILTLPEAATPSGTLTLDWVRPNFSTVRS
jgi:general secretion pathway protein J